MNYMQQQLHLGKYATFHFGIKDSNEMEEWHDGIEFLDGGRISIRKKRN
jgi:hypothetical protein